MQPRRLPVRAPTGKPQAHARAVGPDRGPSPATAPASAPRGGCDRPAVTPPRRESRSRQLVAIVLPGAKRELERSVGWLSLGRRPGAQVETAAPRRTRRLPLLSSIEAPPAIEFDETEYGGTTSETASKTHERERHGAPAAPSRKRASGRDGPDEWSSSAAGVHWAALTVALDDTHRQAAWQSERRAQVAASASPRPERRGSNAIALAMREDCNSSRPATQCRVCLGLSEKGSVVLKSPTGDRELGPPPHSPVARAAETPQSSGPGGTTGR